MLDHRRRRLLTLDGDAAAADLDLNAGGLLPLLIELVAQNDGDDRKRADGDVTEVPSYSSTCLPRPAGIRERDRSVPKSGARPRLTDASRGRGPDVLGANKKRPEERTVGRVANGV